MGWGLGREFTEPLLIDIDFPFWSDRQILHLVVMIAQPGEDTKTTGLERASCPTVDQFTKPTWITYSKPAAPMPFIVWITDLNINSQDIQTFFKFLTRF